ncbi:MAG: MGMT family protein [Candidatus Omnitrophica bacterium]|nr:MGMT family protein [Candidatus Omnitrophota bacterium]
MGKKRKKFSLFAAKVYSAVLNIPLGEVRTYAWVADTIGNPRAARAVGQALKYNPYPLIIPCHRVVCNDHTIGGYSGGVKKKRALLELERRIKIMLGQDS